MRRNVKYATCLICVSKLSCKYH